jgi:phage head maturation protease
MAYSADQVVSHKSFQVELKEANENDLTVTHFISTERRDRGGDILLASGMVTEGKVVVLHSHGYGSMGSEPVAKNLWLKVAEFGNNKGVLAKTQFFPDEVGRRLFLKTSTGYSPNWSIGWRPLKQRTQTEADGSSTRIVESWELLEYSLVGVPMQPDAQTLSQHRDMAFKILPESRTHKNRPASVGTITIPDDLIAQIIKDIIPGAVRQAIQEARGKVK